MSHHQAAPFRVNRQSEPSAKGKVRVLMYHRIGAPRYGAFEKGTVATERFLRQLTVMRTLGYKFWSLDAVASWLSEGNPADLRGVVLTFDDGFGDLYTEAFPALAEIGAGAVIYLLSDMKEDAWRRAKFPDPLPLLTWPQVREMARTGIVFGSHARTHRRLTECGPQELREEVSGSKKRIEDEIGRAVRHFAYPYGVHDERTVDAVREAGYATACTTQKGSVRPGADPLRLPRWSVGKRMGALRFLLRMTVRS